MLAYPYTYALLEGASNLHQLELGCWGERTERTHLLGQMLLADLSPLTTPEMARSTDTLSVLMSLSKAKPKIQL